MEESSKISGVISNLKPRLSYGVNGNVNGIGNFDVCSTVFMGWAQKHTERFNRILQIQVSVNTGLHLGANP